MKQLKLLVTYAKNKKANIKNIDKTVAKQGNTWINCDFKDQNIAIQRGVPAIAGRCISGRRHIAANCGKIGHTHGYTVNR